jgi:hypothetical protein
MRRAEALLIIAMAVSCGGCVLRKPQAAKATPAAPKPAPPPAPVASPPPLSIPQTNVYLPSPQPVTAEALATTIPAGEPTPPQPAPPKPITRPAPSRPSGAPVRVEPATPAPVTPPESEPRPPISELTAPAEQKRLKEEADARRTEVTQLVRRIPKGRQRQQQDSIARIAAFLKQADEAEGRGDMRQASELAQRALVLARELK